MRLGLIIGFGNKNGFIEAWSVKRGKLAGLHAKLSIYLFIYLYRLCVHTVSVFGEAAVGLSW